MSWLTDLMEDIIRKSPDQKVSIRDDYVDIVFDGKVPEAIFVEVEDASGKSIRFGEWIEQNGGYWVLRIRKEDWPA